MLKKFSPFLVLFVIFILIGCEVKEVSSRNQEKVHVASEEMQEKEELQTKIEELQKENAVLKAQAETTSLNEQDQQNGLRETMNLSFDFMQAMMTKDYDTLQKMISPSAVLDKNANKFTFQSENGPVEQHFLLNQVSLKNLEYRFYDIKADTITVGFAIYYDDSHVSVYFTFVKSASGWLLDSFLTN